MMSGYEDILLCAVSVQASYRQVRQVGQKEIQQNLQEVSGNRKDHEMRAGCVEGEETAADRSPSLPRGLLAGHARIR
jgi:hypothetical protein